MKRTVDNEHLSTNTWEAIHVSTHDDKVKRLLDGEIDEAEIAADPVLASLAERIFGLNIEPITPTKPSQTISCLLYTSPSPRDLSTSRMPSSA